MGEAGVHLPGKPVLVPLAEIAAVDVDIAELSDFARLLRDEISDNLEPHAHQIIREHQQGPAFGATSASASMRALRREYLNCQISAVDGLISYLMASRAMLEAIERITRPDRNSDGSVIIRAQDIQKAAATVARCIL